MDIFPRFPRKAKHMMANGNEHDSYPLCILFLVLSEVSVCVCVCVIMNGFEILQLLFYPLLRQWHDFTPLIC